MSVSYSVSSLNLIGKRFLKVYCELIARFINFSVGSKKDVDTKVKDEKEGNSTTIHITLHVLTVYDTNVFDMF